MLYTKVIRHKLVDLLIKCDDFGVLSVDTMPFSTFKDNPNQLANELAEQLIAYLNGQEYDFSSFKLKFHTLSKFAYEVYSHLLQVPYGQLWPYKELGFLMRSRAYMAIGTALSKNPFLIILPCHRIIRSDHTLGNYTCSSGSSVKQIFCDLEQFHRKQLQSYKQASVENFFSINNTNIIP